MKNILLLAVIFISCLSAKAQSTITGTVTDKTNSPLIGVTVYEKGTNNGAYTNDEGNYSIKTGTDAVLIFSFIGYIPQEISITGKTKIDVMMNDATLELTGVVVVGSRSLNRSVTESPVPIDYIDIKALSNDQGQLDINQLLSALAPSFNANRQSGADGADHVDPATLRGLGPDQTLVLINEKRRHQSSLINIFGTRGRGNTGTDLDAITTAAIDHIEILRDGASAQYGSDAIAGVINIVLKKNVGEFSGAVNTGMNMAKYRFDNKSFDGQQFEVNGNYGLKVLDDGYINVSADYLFKGHTNRANQDLFPTSTDVRNQFGNAQLDNFGSMFNSEIPLGGKVKFYSFGGYNFRSTDAYAWTRTAGEARNVTSIYPHGFDPHILSVITDKSLSAGLRGTLGMWNVDFNNTFGGNKFNYFGDSTLNASLVDKSKTRFDDGGFQLNQNTTSLDFTRNYDKCLKGINLAFGTEFRIENYNIFAGEEASWKTYGPIIFSVDSAFNDQGAFTGLDTTYRPGGAQGFPGFQPGDQVNAFRTNLAGYVDVELNFTKSFMADIALRAEHYSDFGNTINGKFAARLALGKNFAIRGSVSTGFRAPSLAQIYFNSTFTDVVGGVIVDKVIASNVSPIARTLGIPSLKQEKATNASFGFTVTPFKGFNASVDGYYVQIKDRIVLTGAFDNSDTTIAADLNAVGVAAAEFFTNAVNTTTMGVDVVLMYSKSFGDSRLHFSVIGNMNNMTIDKIYTNAKLTGKEDIYFGPRDQKFLLASAPPSKFTVSAGYGIKKFNIDVRVNQFGKIDLVNWSGNNYSYTPKTTLDVTLGLDITKNLKLNVGAANLLNTYPDTFDPYETESGGVWDAVQMGFDGTFLFAKLNFTF